MTAPLPPSRLLTELLLVGVALAWGLGFPVMKDAITAHPVLLVLWLRFLLAAGVMLPFAWRSLQRHFRRALRAGVALGTLLFLAFLFLMFGLRLTTAANTGFLAGLGIIWVPVLAGPLLGKPPALGAKIAVVFGLLGLFLMSELDRLSLQWGDMLVVIGSLFTALHILVLDRWSQRHDNLTLSFLQVVTMAALALITHLLMGGEALPASLDDSLILALLVTAVFSTAFAFWVQTTYQRHTTPTRAVLIYNLEPLFSAVFAVLLLQETLSLRVLAGGAVILIGMSLPELLAVRSRRASPATADIAPP